MELGRFGDGVLVGLGRHELGQAEVQDLHPTVAGDHDVLGLEVAVDDARVVGLGQPARRLRRELQGAPRHQRAFAQELAQRLSLHQLHRDVADAVRGADLVDRHDVGVVEGRGRARLLLEARQPVRIPGGRAAEHLDRDRAPEREVAGTVDVAHAARTELLGDLVVPEAPPPDEVDGRWLAHATPVKSLDGFSGLNSLTEQHSTPRPRHRQIASSSKPRAARYFLTVRFSQTSTQFSVVALKLPTTRSTSPSPS